MSLASYLAAPPRGTRRRRDAISYPALHALSSRLRLRTATHGTQPDLVPCEALRGCHDVPHAHRPLPGTPVVPTDRAPRVAARNVQRGSVRRPCRTKDRIMSFTMP